MIRSCRRLASLPSAISILDFSAALEMSASVAVKVPSP